MQKKREAEGPSPTLPPPPAYPIESVDNALQLILMFRRQKAIRLTEASKALGVAHSTAHRLLAMLQYRGFVQQDPASRTYIAGPALVDVGLEVVKELDIRAHARPFLEQLVEELDETAHLVLLHATNVVFADGVESARALRAGNRTGQLLPAHATAAGKALLAHLPLDRLRELYPQQRLPPVTGGTISSRSELEAQLTAIRAQGYATNFEESEGELHAVASAIVGRGGVARGAITVAGPSSRLNAGAVPRIAAAIQRTAAQLATALA